MIKKQYKFYSLNFQIYIVFSKMNKYKEIILKESNIFVKKIIVEKIPST